MSSIAEKFKQLRACVIVPTYNNCGTLGRLLKEIASYTDQVIVVNDGSTDDTQKVLQQFTFFQVIDYSSNRGKGWALRKGFEHARSMGYDYAITIDSDGQHFAEDLPKFLDEIEKHPGSLIIGRRDMAQAGIPGKSSFGNKFSNFWYRVETGYKMEDTQCGYRLYPVASLAFMRFFTRKFEFEIEVIVRAAWRGIRIGAVPVKIHYEEKNKRISHFRPFRDFTRISILNTVLVTIAILYIKPRDFFRGLFNEETRAHWRMMLFHPDDSPAKKSLSIGFGIFMGIFPIWGFQLLVAIGLSILMRLNKALVILAANISVPPFIPIILYLSHTTGKLWMGTNAVDLHFRDDITLATFKNSFAQYFLGAITLSVGLGVMAGLLSFLVLKTRTKTSTQA